MKLSPLEVRLTVHALQNHAQRLDAIAEGDRNSQRKRELLGEAHASRNLASRLSRLASGSSLEVSA